MFLGQDSTPVTALSGLTRTMSLSVDLAETCRGSFVCAGG